MKTMFLLFAALAFTGDEIPFKLKDEYELKMEFQFKPRPTEAGSYKVELQYERISQSNGPLPYLILHLAVIKQLDDEVRIKVVTNDGKTLVAKKLDKAKTVTLDLGFTDDLKDHVKPYEYTYFFLNAEKEVVRKIVVHFEEDGTYLVNSEKRGKI
jgi:hypothetical protein